MDLEMTTNSRVGEVRGSWQRAFTRLDLCSVCAALVMLLGLAGLNFTGEGGRVTRCAWNLKRLGRAVTDYAGDHDGGLPPASIEPSQATWDSLITPYLCPELAATKSAYTRRVLQDAVALRLLCPSDSLARESPRTYAMSGHDMRPENWPPGPDNATGVGLAWSQQRVETWLGSGALEQAKTNSQMLALVKLSWLPDPAGTLLLTEVVRSDNTLGNPATAAVGGARRQLELFTGDQRRFHHGCFNYLMADGHVELLSPFQPGMAGGYKADRPAGIWTIKAGD